jgi:hypothetical protein
LDDVRPSSKLPDDLLKVCANHSWNRVGILDLEGLPQQIYGTLAGSGVSLVNISSERNFKRTSDPNELSMLRTAVSMVRRILETELLQDTSATDFILGGRLERSIRRAGIEDLLLLFSDGKTAPGPARGTKFTDVFSVVVAAEYRGCWVRVARTQAAPPIVQQVRGRFEELLKLLGREKVSPAEVCLRNVSGSYPYEYVPGAPLGENLVFSADVEVPINGARLFYGDMCRLEKHGVELL